jgi:superfamily II DNA/RNA helicase
MARRGGKRRRERKRDATYLSQSVSSKDSNSEEESVIQRNQHEHQPSTKKKAKYSTHDSANNVNGDDGNESRTSVTLIHDNIDNNSQNDDSGEQNVQNSTTLLPSPMNDVHDDETDEMINVLWSAFQSLSSKPTSVVPSKAATTATPVWQPTLIQRHVWPTLLKTSYNMVSISPTGSGKTISYALPCVIRQSLSLVHGREKDRCAAGSTVLVLVPTRELVHQVVSTFVNVIEAVACNTCDSNVENNHVVAASASTSKSRIKRMVVPIHGGVPREGQRRAIQQARDEQRRQYDNQQRKSVESLQQVNGHKVSYCDTVVMVATPGRFLDLLKEQEGDEIRNHQGQGQSETLIPTPIPWIVLDEADQLTKEGDLGPQVDEILSRVKAPSRHKSRLGSSTNPSFASSRLTLVSATYPQKCRSKFREWLGPSYVQVIVDGMKDAELKQNEQPAVSASTSEYHDVKSNGDRSNDHTNLSSDRYSKLSLTEIPPHLEQIVHVCSEHKKPRKLVNLLKQWEGMQNPRTHTKGVIFYSKIEKLRVSERLLQKEGFQCVCLHGQLSVERRQRNLNFFGKFGNEQETQKKPHHKNLIVLLATDVAARGVDIPRINFVVQYDFPSNLEQYAHRCGRAGRSVTPCESTPNSDGMVRSNPEKYAVYSFFTRNLAPLAADLIQLLEGSNAWVDPNLRELMQPRKPRSADGHDGSKHDKRKTQRVENADREHKKEKDIGRDDSSDHDNENDEEEFAHLSGNRIVLKRAGHVSDASDDDEDGDD